MIRAGLAAAMFAVGTRAAAQQAPAYGFATVSVGVAHGESSTGLNVGLGGGRTFHALAVAVYPVDLTILKGSKNGRYYTDTFSNGQSRCRDSYSGQFASSSKCGSTPETKYAAMVDASLLFARGTTYPFQIGGGYRAGFAATPYGFVQIAMQPESKPGGAMIRVAAGRDYFSAVLGGTISFPLTGRAQ